MQAVHGFGSFRGTTIGEFHGWLRRILLHSLSDYERKESHRARPIPPECEPADQSVPMCLPMEVESAADELRCRLPHLAAAYQEVLRLRYWENLSWRAVGKRLHRSTDAARMLHTRALQALRCLCTLLPGRRTTSF